MEVFAELCYSAGLLCRRMNACRKQDGCTKEGLCNTERRKTVNSCWEQNWPAVVHRSLDLVPATTMKSTVAFAQAIAQDLNYGMRQLRSSPVFFAVAILTLALGVGVNTSIFTLLNAIMLRPLAVPDSAGLYEVLRGVGRPCSYPDFLDYQQRTRTFSSLGRGYHNRKRA